MCAVAFDTRDGGLVQVSGRVKRWHDRSTPGVAAVPILVSESGDTVETKKAAQRITGSIFASAAGVAVSIIRAGETVARSIDARRRCSGDR